MGMVQQLVALIRTEHSPFHEHVLGALCSLVTDFPQGVRECREPELGLEELLRHRCQLLQQHEEYQEELEFCEKLLQTCFQPDGRQHGSVNPGGSAPPLCGNPRRLSPGRAEPCWCAARAA